MFDWITPIWPAPANVKALVTTRQGGVSGGPYASLNLGDHVGDDPQAVSANRALLRAHLPGEPLWLKQVHTTHIAETANACGVPEADASIARQPHQICVVLTADCLPVLLCDRAGSVVAAVHAGWRGLAAGVIEQTAANMNIAPENLLAWLGPAIGPDAFEVGEEVRAAFVAQNSAATHAFHPARPGKWLADLYHLARLRLAGQGIQQVYGGNFCTYRDSQRFFSYRRDQTTGRMASLVWLT